MPGVPFPAICVNPSCGTLFFASSLIGVPSINDAITVKNFGVGPCPKCGSGGLVPDGAYSPLEARIHDPVVAAKVLNLIAILRGHIAAPASMVDLMNNLGEAGVAPKNWTPKNLDEAVKFFGAIILLLTFLYTIYKDHKELPKPVGLSAEMKQVIEMILDSSQRASPPTAQQFQPPTVPPPRADHNSPPPTKK